MPFEFVDVLLRELELPAPFGPLHQLLGIHCRAISLHHGSEGALQLQHELVPLGIALKYELPERLDEIERLQEGVHVACIPHILEPREPSRVTPKWLLPELEFDIEIDVPVFQVLIGAEHQKPILVG